MRRIEVGDAESVAALIRDAFSRLPAVIDPPSGALHIGRLAMAPGWRGRVIARGTWRRRRALPRLCLGVRLALEGNRRMFARLGFVGAGLRSYEGYAEPTSVDMDLYDKPRAAPPAGGHWPRRTGGWPRSRKNLELSAV